MCCMLYWDLAGVFSFTRNESPDRSPAVVEEGVIEGRPSLKRSTVEPASKARCALELKSKAIAQIITQNLVHFVVDARLIHP